MEIIAEKIVQNYQNTEPNIKIEILETLANSHFDAKSSRQIINILNSVHSGVWQMSHIVPNLVQTSNNLGVIQNENGEIKIINMVRSSDDFELQLAVNQILNIVQSNFEVNFEPFGKSKTELKIKKILNTDPNKEKNILKTNCTNSQDSLENVDQNMENKNSQNNPTNNSKSNLKTDLKTDLENNLQIFLSETTSGWKAEKDNVLLDKFQKIHSQITGKNAEIKAIHAGLECGFLKDYLPKSNVISFGPQIDDAHSPKEHVKITSVEEFYCILQHLLANL